jgi:hypothetical protein
MTRIADRSGVLPCVLCLSGGGSIEQARGLLVHRGFPAVHLRVVA